MITKTDIRKLLSKGLTGKEAGRLILQDNWLVDHGKEGLLTQREIQAVKASLKTQQDIQDYNSYVDTYRLVDYTLKEAHILALEIQRDVLLITEQVDTFFLEDKVRWIQIVIPAIVTQKQYEELRAKQRERKLQTIHTLYEVFDCRAYDMAPEDIQEEARQGETIQDLANYLSDKYPAIYQEVVRKILQLIKEGRLKPVELDKKARSQIEAHRAKEQEQRDREKEQDTEHTPDYYDLLWTGLEKEEQELLQASYLSARSHRTQEDIDRLISLLEKYIQSPDLPASEAMSNDEQSQLIDYTVCSEEDLYLAGLPEWIKWVDNYTPNWDAETAARPVGMMQSFSVAIIQDPEPKDLDERGYYKETDPLSGLSGRKKKQSEDIIDNKALLTMQSKIRSQLRAFLAFQTVMDIVSGLIGIDFSEDIRDYLEMTTTIIELYNSRVEARRLPKYLGMPDLKPIKLESLKPAQKTVKYIQERMAISLGAGWQETGEALIQELKEKEAQDGQEE